MHILILPSWYPADNDFSGIFIKEQGVALANYSSNHISVINWGPNEFVMKLRSPVQSLQKIFSYSNSVPEKIQHKLNLVEYKIPHITWTSHILKGNCEALLIKVINQIKQIQIESGPIDIIHAHVSFPAGYIAKSISERLLIPYIITEHSGPFPFNEFIRSNTLKSIVKIPLTNAERVIAVSTWLAACIKKWTDKETIIIPNSVNADFFKPSSSFSGNSVPRIFTLSNLTYSKGLSDLLKAAQVLKMKGCSFQLRIGGEGRQGQKLRKQATNLKLEECTTWLGKISRESALVEYQNCDFFVMPSRLESLSMVILEALACGKPVVATDCGGPSDLLNKDNGILVPASSPGLLAKGIEEMLHKYELYDSNSIRNLCVDKYSENYIVRRILDVYNEVLISI